MFCSKLLFVTVFVCLLQSHHEEGEGEISEGEPEAEDSSDEGRGALEHRDLLDRLRLHRPDKVDLRVSHVPTYSFIYNVFLVIGLVPTPCGPLPNRPPKNCTWKRQYPNPARNM